MSNKRPAGVSTEDNLFDVFRKYGSDVKKIDEVFEGERRLVIDAGDGKTHIGSVRIKRIYCGVRKKVVYL
jgi:hypothetical protein